MRNRTKLTFAEGGALVCGICTAAGTTITLAKPVFDWLDDSLKPASHYLFYGLAFCFPFLLGFLIFGYLVRRGGKTNESHGHGSTEQNDSPTDI